eukprot:CAMPEP_0184388054 /NCGR_PEP_ID=MMETSP0007-20130409/11276_1 /TAXON_ID=97485 /ORGANISM="Prymnesium parvum, Strain Texoma1" /LENGTH=69 /DNA_ID=CAMNT_0026736741 /DNA_START=148 /DNA_END=353 /DNA_ORIENTATION=-
MERSTRLASTCGVLGAATSLVGMPGLSKRPKSSGLRAVRRELTHVSAAASPRPSTSSQSTHSAAPCTSA